MQQLFSDLEQAFLDYRGEIEAFEKKRRPTDGLLGFGHSLRDDACHDRLDEKVERAAAAIAGSCPSPEEAERAVRFLLSRAEQPWPLAAQWMLRAVDRHCIPLIPFLLPEAAGAIYREYAARYRPFDRLPAQKELLKALKKAQDPKNDH